MLYLNILKGKKYVDVAFMQGIELEKQFPILKNENKRKKVRSVQLHTLEELDLDNFKALLLAAASLLIQSKKSTKN